ncbi:ABC transporter permease [Rhodococcoides kyotonense]|uniref:Transport permease protein n=1 Tax=Rhodococcoides kyotonense TaxID=398843 RepID=A0A239KIF0_9NOCA|nr:ABC transporter permease [Rhodococcus kyotonensis]SNT17403.1 ABC-2 type transport system permease protein [Rhodococcus kyotonensis]
MTSTSLAIRDSAVMFRRNLIHLRRYPSMTALLIGMPVVFLLLFVYVFGGTLGAGLPGAGGRAAYLAYVTPAIVVMAAASAAQGTAISVATDMTEGIIARFRTMAISPGSVLTGHVAASVVQGLLAMTALLLVAIGLGFRPEASPLDWLALLSVLTMLSLSLTWLSVALGLVSDSVETASNLPMFLIILPFLGSGFVPTDSMPTALRWFAEYQPFTPVIETVRGLLEGQAQLGTSALALGWCASITAVGYLWARASMRRERTR